MIEVKNLTKRYGDHTVVNNLSFTIEPGKIYGFLGPNGAGKSTTMNMITGALAPTSGTVLIDGHDIYEEAALAKKSIGYLPEIPPVYPDMTPEEYLRFVAEAKGIRGKDVFEQIYRVMEETDIIDVRERLIKNLSKGYKQRVGIAQAMLGDPSLIILDEPTVGLDPRQISEIRALISKLGESRTIILSSHILSEVQSICDKVLIISSGKIVAYDTLDAIRLENSPENSVKMTVRGKESAIKSALASIYNVLSYEISESDEGKGIFDLVINAGEGCDIREELFDAMSKQGITVRTLARIEPSLEEIFFKLTEIAPESIEEESEEDELEYDDDEYDDEEDEDYTPIFARRKKDEDEDEEDDE